MSAKIFSMNGKKSATFDVIQGNLSGENPMVFVWNAAGGQGASWLNPACLL